MRPLFLEAEVTAMPGGGSITRLDLDFFAAGDIHTTSGGQTTIRKGVYNILLYESNPTIGTLYLANRPMPSNQKVAIADFGDGLFLNYWFGYYLNGRYVQVPGSLPYTVTIISR